MKLGFERRQVEMAIASPSTSRRDRTSEFIAIADRLRKSSSSSQQSSYGSLPYANGSSDGAYAGRNGETARLLPSSGSSVASEFNKRASLIGLSLHQTSQKLAKLAKCEWLSCFFYVDVIWLRGTKCLSLVAFGSYPWRFLH